jgi:tripartite-type tricarboxylate transporter receptor subunit TctC
MKKIALAVISIAALFCGSASADTWPSKPIKLVVPYAPGGYTDGVSRITARFMEKELGQPIVVENRAGGGGIVGSDFLSKSPKDGYTICMCSVGAVSVAPVAQKTSYDPLKSFRPISIVSTIPQTVIVNPSLPVNSIEDLVTYAKANPGKLNFGSSGAGGLMYFSVALFEARTGTKMVHVPFKGGAPATAAVVSGEVNLTFTNMTDALPQIEAKTVKALAITSKNRSEFAPQLPTIAEKIGVLSNYNVESWNGVMAPAGTSEDIVQKLSAVYKKMAADPEVKKQMAVIGASTVFTTPDGFQTQINQEVEQWKTLLKEISGK